MHHKKKKEARLMAAGLLVLFITVFFFSIRELKQVSTKSQKDITAAAAAIGKIRMQVKSEIKSPDDPEARFMYELRRLRSPKTGKIPENIRQKELAFSATIPTSELVKFNKLGPGARGMVLNWDHRGPFNIGGRTRALAIDVANTNTILAGGVSGGMWRSTNNGQSWVKTTDPSLLQSVTTVSQDKRSGRTATWYYGTGELEGNSASAPGALYRGNGIYKSTNNGQSWSVLASTVTNNLVTFNNVFQWVWRVATNPANATQDEVIAATIGGIQRSTDGGATWQNALGTISGGTATNSFSRYTDVAISASGVMYATLSQFSSNGGTSTVKGIFRSTNGQTWTDITPADFPARYDRIVLDISPSNENIVYFLASTPSAGKFKASFFKYTYISGTGAGTGGNWENRSANIPGFGGKVGDLNLQGNYNMLVKVKPDNPNVVFMGGTNLYRSTNGFASTANTSWIGGYSTKNNVSVYENHHPDQHDLVFYPGNVNRAISAHDGGLSETSLILAEPVVWTSLNRGYLTTQFTSVAIDLNDTDDLIMGGMQDNGTYYVQSKSGTAAWDDLLSGDGAYGAAVGNSLFASAQNGFIYRFGFTSTGAFRGFARVDPKGGSGYLFVNPYVLDPNNENVMYLPAGDTLWRNSNIDAIPLCNPSPSGGGAAVDCSGSTVQPSTNWKVINTIGPTQSISAVVISKTPANIVYFGTNNGEVYRLDNALSNTPTRTRITGSNFPTAGAAPPYVSSIAVDPTNANNVTVVFSNYEVVSIFQTSNGGTSWTPIAGNLEENPDGSGNGPSVRWINILPSRTGGATKYFVGTSTGVYATANINGMATNWIKEGATTIGSVPVDMIVSRPTDNLVVIGTHGNGVYSHYYNEALAVADPVIPENFTVNQNYPNPFSPDNRGTTISYSLARAGRVVVQIYDLAGREIARLVDGQQNAGENRVRWNGRNRYGGTVANGIYIYRVQFEKEQMSKQMLLRR